MTPQWLATIFVGLLVPIFSFAAYWLSTRQLKEQATARAKQVDALAYERAEKIYNAAIEQLTDEAARMREERTGLRAERDGLRRERDQLARELDEIRAERDRLHRINNQLENEVGALRGFRDEAARLREANTRLEADLTAARRNGTPG